MDAVELLIVPSAGGKMCQRESERCGYGVALYEAASWRRQQRIASQPL